MKFHRIIPVLIIAIIFFSCKKWNDPLPPQDPRIQERKYCNDPEAVNYNWNFPGQPDNTVCIFPSDLFKGTYSFTDSIYNSENVFDSIRPPMTYTLEIIPVSKSMFRVTGFCVSGDSLRFTAERSTYRANADSTIMMNDTTKVFGQYFCRTLDTLSGSFAKDRRDTTNSFLTIDLKVVSDTGINFHRGTAIKL